MARRRAASEIAAVLGRHTGSVKRMAREMGLLLKKIEAAPFLYMLKRSGTEFGAGIKYAVERGWLDLHESGTYVRLLTPGDDLLGQ
ncbi:hypothetical protein ABIB90_007783 [Bradyrhizobium sp. JR4.1]|uniref:hypothetical protein n=1 Tax=unclassified Bradyrhizobium TaxID=2631580 RepID=UPI00025D2D69|nr:hypothetical protein [Bradyrhizobium sp. WSM1253]EIG62206.1 hypothetical protein Bra1253DRAFT_07098 [Bradyrhizobium sp. WSM1253]